MEASALQVPEKRRLSKNERASFLCLTVNFYLSYFILFAKEKQVGNVGREIHELKSRRNIASTFQSVIYIQSHACVV